MDFRKLADKAKKTIDERGGTERLKQDAERLRHIATGPGSAKDKARAAGESLKQPGGAPPAAGEGRARTTADDPRERPAG